MSKLLLISINDTLSVYRHYAKIFQCEMHILEYIKSNANDNIIYPMIERDCGITHLKIIADVPSFPSTTIVLSKQIGHIITLLTKGSIMVENIIFDKNVSALCHDEHAHNWQMWIQDNLHKMSDSICQYKNNYCWTPITDVIDSNYRSFAQGIEIFCRDNITTVHSPPSTTLVNIANSAISAAGGIIIQIIDTTIPDVAFNSTTTSSTAEISKSILFDNTASWIKTGINFINHTIINFTNTTFNTTYHSQENMFDESKNDTSLVFPYISVGIAVTVSIAAVVGAGVTWYIRSKNAQTAKLKQYIEEIEAIRLTARIHEDIMTDNNAILDNEHAVVDMTGVIACAEAETGC